METTVKKQKKNLETKKPSIYSLQLHEMQDWLKEHGEPKFRAGQIFDWLYKKRVKNFEDMSNLAKGLRDKLSNSFDITTLNTLVKQTSSDGTIKFLFELYDGYSIETVLMRHEYGNSICVTTQVGCRIGCTFCASTLGGLKRNLEAGEIVAQVVEVQHALDETDERVSSLVIMGIGEPFDNYDNMMSFLRIVNHEKGFILVHDILQFQQVELFQKFISLLKKICKLILRFHCMLQIQSYVQELMPINRAYKLPDLMEAVKYYVK